MNLVQLYEELPTICGISEEQKSLLLRIMNLENPINFNFATDEEMDALEDALDRAEREGPHCRRLKELTFNLQSKISESNSDFV
jgi:hypothetical protein